MKVFKVCGLSNALDGSENNFIRCAKDLPEFSISYRVSAKESDEDKFSLTDEDEEDEHDKEEDDEEEDETSHSLNTCRAWEFTYTVLHHGSSL